MCSQLGETRAKVVSMQREPSVIAFAGHMTDAKSGPARFPEARVPAVRAAIHEKLVGLHAPLVGVSSAARGGDLLFLEALLALGGSAQIILPFPAEDFRRTSVGHGWNDAFDRALGAERVTLAPPIHDQLPATDEARGRAFGEVNREILRIALALAVQRHAEPLFLALYHSSDQDKEGGTKRALDEWQREGRRVAIVDPLP